LRSYSFVLLKGCEKTLFRNELAVSLFIPIYDPTLRQVVRREFDPNPVSRKNSDVIHSHLAADMRKQLNVVTLVQLDTKPRAWQILKDNALNLDALFFVLLLLVLRSASSHSTLMIPPSQGPVFLLGFV
jgi:hypothetical protein